MKRKGQEGLELLGNAVIVLAVKDYRSVCRYLEKHPAARNASKEKLSLERFFRSQYFTIFTDLDGKVLLRKLQEEFDV